jgi:hypothetical protein
MHYRTYALSSFLSASVLALVATLGACSGGSDGGGSGGSAGATGGSGGASGGGGGSGAVCGDCDTCLQQKCDTQFQAMCGASFPGGFECPGGPCGAYEQCIIDCAKKDNCGCVSCGCENFNCGLNCATSCDSLRTPDCDTLNSDFSKCKKTSCATECADPWGP